MSDYNISQVGFKVINNIMIIVPVSAELEEEDVGLELRADKDPSNSPFTTMSLLR